MNQRLSEYCRNIQEKIPDMKVGAQTSIAPKVSVVIPAYGVAEFIEQTLSSVFAQTYSDYEVVLVNDGALDTAEMEKVLAPFMDKLIYVKKENGGASSARNMGICIARGKIIAFLDGDDIWMPEFLESQVKHLEENDLEMVYCNAILFGEKIYDGVIYMDIAPSNGEVTPEKLISGECGVITSGTLVIRDCFEENRLFDETLYSLQDYEMWFRLAKGGIKIGYQKKILLKYQVRRNSLSGSSVKQAERNIKALNILKEKYELTPSEQATWDRQAIITKAELELETGKFYLAKEDYKQALVYLTEANKYYQKTKLTVIIALLKLSPKLTFIIFKRIRPAEFSFVTSTDI